MADEALARFPIAWNHAIEKEPRNFEVFAHVLVAKVDQLLRDMR